MCSIRPYHALYSYLTFAKNLLVKITRLQPSIRNNHWQCRGVHAVRPELRGRKFASSAYNRLKEAVPVHTCTKKMGPTFNLFRISCSRDWYLIKLQITNKRRYIRAVLLSLHSVHSTSSLSVGVGLNTDASRLGELPMYISIDAYIVEKPVHRINTYQWNHCLCACTFGAFRCTITTYM